MHAAFKGIQHVGIVVRDMQQTLQFYRDVFGVEPEFILHSSGQELSRAVDVPDADLSLAFLHFGNTFLELLEYHHPKGKNFDRANSDVGVMHICFEVADIAATQKLLKEKGIEFNAPPIRIDEGPLAGYAFAYFKGHDGISFELFEVPSRE